MLCKKCGNEIEEDKLIKFKNSYLCPKCGCDTGYINEMERKKLAKREVSRASKIPPEYIKKSKLLLLSIFLGWTGAQNFYAKNKRKGWISIITLIIWFGVGGLAKISKFFSSIQILVGGLAGFINLFIWISDIINVITNQFEYKIQKDAFISCMNVETRVKLGESKKKESLDEKTLNELKSVGEDEMSETEGIDSEK